MILLSQTAFYLDAFVVVSQSKRLKLIGSNLLHFATFYLFFFMIPSCSIWVHIAYTRFKTGSQKLPTIPVGAPVLVPHWTELNLLVFTEAAAQRSALLASPSHSPGDSVDSVFWGGKNRVLWCKDRSQLFTQELVMQMHLLVSQRCLRPKVFLWVSPALYCIVRKTH